VGDVVTKQIYEFEQPTPLLTNTRTFQPALSVVAHSVFRHGIYIIVLKGDQSVDDAIDEGNCYIASDNGKHSNGPHSIDITLTTDGISTSWAICTEPVSFYQELQTLQQQHGALQQAHEADTDGALPSLWPGTSDC
jgi:hypothetical protein